MYGRIHSGNNAQGGRASGMPFAIVPAAKRPGDVHAFGYRYATPGGNCCPCPRAAYIWLDKEFPILPEPRPQMLNLNHLVNTGATDVVKALLVLKEFIDESFHSVVGKWYPSDCVWSKKAFTRRTDVNK